MDELMLDVLPIRVQISEEQCITIPQKKYLDVGKVSIDANEELYGQVYNVYGYPSVAFIGYDVYRNIGKDAQKSVMERNVEDYTPEQLVNMDVLFMLYNDEEEISELVDLVLKYKKKNKIALDSQLFVKVSK